VRAEDRLLGPAPAGTELTISIYLKPGSEGIAAPATDGDVGRVTSFLERHGLRVVSVEPRGRLIRASGGREQIEAAFGVGLASYERDGARYLAPDGPLSVPADAAPLVQAVLGLDTRPLTRGGGPPIRGSSAT
jgi:kumamolisin